MWAKCYVNRKQVTEIAVDHSRLQAQLQVSERKELGYNFKTRSKVIYEERLGLVIYFFMFPGAIESIISPVCVKFETNQNNKIGMNEGKKSDTFLFCYVEQIRYNLPTIDLMGKPGFPLGKPAMFHHDCQLTFSSQFSYLS